MTPTPTPGGFTGILRPDDPIILLLLNVIRGLAILAVALILSRFIKGWIIRIASRSQRVSLNVATLLGNVATVTVTIIGVIASLPWFGVEWAGFVTVLGAAGLAVSLSMQDLLKNVVAGIYILMEQPFSIGDRISVKEATGVVEGIELRTTILTTDEDLQVIVPNSVVLNEIVTNRSVSKLQRQVIQMRVKKGSLVAMNELINAALADAGEVAVTPTPVIALERVNDGIAWMRIEFWAPGPKRVALTAQVAESLQARFPDANITVL